MDRLTGLLVAARDGDDLALASAIRTAQPDVRRFLRLLVDPAELDDAVQDTFVRAYGSLGRFRAESSGRTWLLSIARRVAADTARRAARVRRLRHRVEHDRGATTTPALGEEHALRELIEGLDPERREAFVLTQLIGCPYLEAADICRVPVGTIRSRVARAREQLLEEVRAARTA
ncbi:MAG: sigma-70 family RNA polymerase sigma factor [Acidimicrobiia bacterium]